jgi:thiamine-monophosphate kinase
LHGGEDYELLFTVPPQARVPRQLAGVPLTEIGRITRSRSIILRDSNGVARQLEARGWEHFSRGRKARETSH